MSDIPGPDPDSGSDTSFDIGRGLRVAVLVIISLAIVGVVLGGYHQVPEGHVGVQKTFGAVTGEELQPGAHVIIPVVNSVQNTEIRPRTYTMANTQGEGDRATQSDAVTVQTVNGTTVDIDITVRYNVQETDASGFVTEWRAVTQAEERLIRPSVRSQLRDEAAGIQTSEIYTSNGRERLSEAAKQKLEAAFEGRALVLQEVQVRDVDLPDSYDEALNEKEIAKQRVEQKKFEIQQAEREKERQEIQAEADARVIEIRGQALQENPVVLRQQYIKSIDASDKVILATDNDGTPIILQTGSSGNETASNTDVGLSTNSTTGDGTRGNWRSVVTKVRRPGVWFLDLVLAQYLGEELDREQTIEHVGLTTVERAEREAVEEDIGRGMGRWHLRLFRTQSYLSTLSKSIHEG